MANTADRIYDMIAQAVLEQGVQLWDVAFVKEGASHYLRVFIDKPGGVTIDDCTNVSHAIDPILDREDPIEDSYYLEVSSPGVDRELKRKEHFSAFIGHNVTLKLYRAFEEQKQLTGKLIAFEDGPVIETPDGRKLTFSSEQVSKAQLKEDF